MSSRSLRRRLQEEGIVVPGTGRRGESQVAIKYVRDTSLSIEDVTDALGFNDASAFRHAFRRWTGAAPYEFRAGESQHAFSSCLNGRTTGFVAIWPNPTALWPSRTFCVSARNLIVTGHRINDVAEIGRRCALIPKTDVFESEDQEVLSFPANLLLRRGARSAGDHSAQLGRRCSDGLTARECEVLAMISQGLSNKRVARTLEISPETVKSHVKHIFLKLDVSTRTEAVFSGYLA